VNWKFLAFFELSEFWLVEQTRSKSRLSGADGSKFGSTSKRYGNSSAVMMQDGVAWPASDTLHLARPAQLADPAAQQGMMYFFLAPPLQYCVCSAT